MYINIGNEKVIKQEDIQAVFDFDSTTVSARTKKFLAQKQKERKVITLGYDIPKSFVLMNDGTIYLSPFNTSTITGMKSRSNKIL